MHPIPRLPARKAEAALAAGHAAGKGSGCFGSPSRHGSDPGGMETRARADGNQFILSGVKRWIHQWEHRRHRHRLGEDAEGIRGFLWSQHPGLSARTTSRASSRAVASITSELVLDEVRVPRESMLPGVVGLKGPFSCLTQARYGIVWGALGAAMACYHTALEYAKDRKQFDKPLAGFQLVATELVHMLTEITKDSSSAYRLGQLKDHGTLRPQHVSLAKRNNVGHALEIARLAARHPRGKASSNEYPVIRHMLNLETVNTYEGTYDMQR